MASFDVYHLKVDTIIRQKVENYWMSHYVGMASFDVYHLKVDTIIRQRWKIIGCPTTLVWPVLMCII